MPPPPLTPDFDTLVALHECDQDAFESLRRSLLEEAVASAPACRQPALHRLLRRIEANRAEAASPQQAVAQAFIAMADSLQELRLAWQQAFHALGELQTQILLERVR